MSNEDWLTREPLRGLLDELIAKTVTQYRISLGDAQRLIHECFAANHELQNIAHGETSSAKLKRSRVFKQAASDAKRSVYYHLRSYKSDESDVIALAATLQELSPDSPRVQREQLLSAMLASHASTRERIDCADEFFQQLFAMTDSPESILDVGCGMHPLMFPFEHDWAQRIAQYVAVDNDPQSIACVESYGRVLGGGRVVALHWDIADGWQRVLAEANRSQFDLALLMKLVPVVTRQERELLQVLTQTPARTWLVTGSTISMTKHVSIERREKNVLRKFVQQSGREVQHEFTVGEEFAWLVV
jgi:hypothetical protein